jgi:hypothetical protein
LLPTLPEAWRFRVWPLRSKRFLIGAADVLLRVLVPWLCEKSLAEGGEPDKKTANFDGDVP